MGRPRPSDRRGPARSAFSARPTAGNRRSTTPLQVRERRRVRTISRRNTPNLGCCRSATVGIQLVDLPPLSPGHPVPWIANALQPGDGAMLVVDLSRPGCVAGVEDLLVVLAQKKVRLIGDWPRGAEEPTDPDDPFAKLLPTVVVAARAHEIDDVESELAILEDLVGLDLPTLHASVVGDDIDHIGPWLFDALGVVRVYTESAVKRDDRPYTIRRGQTVIDVAGLVHKDFARQFKYARLLRRRRTGSTSRKGLRAGRR